MPSGTDAMKIRKLLEERERRRIENAEKLKLLQAEEKMKPQQMIDKFSSYKDEVEDQLRASTIGLVSLQQMKERTNKILEDRDLRAVKDRATQMLREKRLAEAKDRAKNLKRKNTLSKLSFGDEHEEEDSDSEGESEEEQDMTNIHKLENEKLQKLIDGEASALKEGDEWWQLTGKKEEKDTEGANADINPDLPGPSTGPAGPSSSTAPAEVKVEAEDLQNMDNIDPKTGRPFLSEAKKIDSKIEDFLKKEIKLKKEESLDSKDGIRRVKRIKFHHQGGKKTLRNTEADSSYLPNAARNEDEMELRKQLREEWEQIQLMEKNTVFGLPFLFWDGIGHPYEVTLKKGNTIYQFLSRAIDFIKQDFPDLHSLTPEHLVFVKDDLILPHYYTFYNLVMNKIVSKQGNLLEFETMKDELPGSVLRSDRNPNEPGVNSNIAVEEDKPKEEKKMVEIYFTHQGAVKVEEQSNYKVGRVILRSWYEKNKHIFPASRWEAFDPVTMVKAENLTKANDSNTEDFYKRML